jgi:hypothetical protein
LTGYLIRTQEKLDSEVKQLSGDISPGIPESAEESVFKTLSNQKRRDVLRFIGERNVATFTEIKNSVKIEESASLAYHLNMLSLLLTQDGGKYRLSELGLDAYNLMCRITTYSASASIVRSLRKILPLTIIANAILWATALLSVRLFEGTPAMDVIFTFAGLWFISNIILYTSSKKVAK